MNMISTGAFLNEMDASNKQPTVAEKFAAVWEKKNAKAARAGGVSLMALSLAACGSSSTTTSTTTTTTTTPAATPTGDAMSLTSGTDTVTASSASLNGSASTVRFKDGSNETVSAQNSTIQATDNLIDGDSSDADVLNVTISGAMNAMTATNIETVNVTTAAGSSQAVTLTNFSGTKTVNVSGSHDLTVDDAGAANVVFNAYTQDATVNNDSLAGTADAWSVEVSGGTWGTKDSTQTNIILTADGTSGTLETLNVTSSGSAANTFGLDAGTGVTLKAVTVDGAADATIRVTHTDVTAKTIDATAATGDVTLRVDMQGTSAALNALNMSGIDNFLMVDSTVGSDAASISNMVSGQSVVIGDDMDASTFTMASATASNPASSLKITLDNETADADLDVANINAQNIESLELVSKGYSGSAATAAENSTGTVDGDFTTITISGDTSLDTVLDIDAAGTAETTARTVTVNASANTAFVTIDAVDDQYVSYEITGSAGNDTLKLNETAGVVNGGAGKDTIHSSGKNDTIDAGAGNDTVYASTGTDTVTLGAGNDKIYFGEIDVAATAKVVKTGDASIGLTPVAANDDFIVTVNGKDYKLDIATNGDQGHDIADDFVAAFADTILADSGVTVVREGTSTDDTAGLKFTGKSDGSDFTVAMSISDAGVPVTGTVATTTAAVAAVSVNTKISDFEVGTATAGGDKLGFDVSELNALITDLSDSAGDVVDTATDGNVMHTYTVGTAQGTGDVDNGANIIYIKQSDTINAAADVITALAANNIELDAAMATSDGIVSVFYDTDDAKLVFGLLVNGGASDATVDGDFTFSAMGEMAMTKADYALIDATNFEFIA